MKKISHDEYISSELKKKSKVFDYIEQHQDSAESIVLYGSLANKTNNDNSDIDLLFIGDGLSLHSREMDVKWISKSQLTQKSWLGSELANHVATYGIVLKGNMNWKSEVFVSKSSANMKLNKVLKRLTSIYIKKKSLSICQKMELLKKVLLEIERFFYLSNGMAVPPTKEVISRIKSHPDFVSKVIQNERIGNIMQGFFENILGSCFRDSLKDTINKL